MVPYAERQSGSRSERGRVVQHDQNNSQKIIDPKLLKRVKELKPNDVVILESGKVGFVEQVDDKRAVVYVLKTSSMKTGLTDKKSDIKEFSESVLNFDKSKATGKAKIIFKNFPKETERVNFLNEYFNEERDLDDKLFTIKEQLFNNHFSLYSTLKSWTGHASRLYPRIMTILRPL